MPNLETNTRKIVRRLESEGWATRGGGAHDVFKHPSKSGRIQVPRHREVSIARMAGWLEEDEK
jgi:predicted RNA binding protein YcfA (HicA-like mRNA interferase family)